MKIRVDLHNHLSTFSYKGVFNKVINKASRELGSGGVLGVLDSYNMKGDYDPRYERFSELPGYERTNLGNAIYVPEKNLLVVHGQEAETRQGHILIFGLPGDRQIKHNHLEDVMEESVEENAILILDHPFFLGTSLPYLRKRPSLFQLLDGFEVQNGEACLPIPPYFFANQRAKRFYDLFIKPSYYIGAMSFSDGHSIAEIGSNFTWLDEPDITDSESLIRTLKSSIRQHKDYDIDGNCSSFMRATEHALKMIPMILRIKSLD